MPVDQRLLFVGAGQSNEVSSAHAADFPDQTLIVPNEKIRFFDQSCASSDPTPVALFPTTGAYTDLKPRTGQKAGWELAAGRLLAAHFGQGAMVKHGCNGSNLASQWLPTSPPLAGHAANLLTELRDVIRAKELAMEAEFRGLFWCQGNGDAAVLGKANAYAANLEIMWSWLLAELGRPGAVLVIDRLHEDIVQPFVAIVRAQQLLFAASRTGVIVFGTDHLNLRDEDHYDTPAQQELGYLVGQAWLAALGVTTDIAADLQAVGEWAADLAVTGDLVGEVATAGELAADLLEVGALQTEVAEALPAAIIEAAGELAATMEEL